MNMTDVKTIFRKLKITSSYVKELSLSLHFHSTHFVFNRNRVWGLKPSTTYKLRYADRGNPWSSTARSSHLWITYLWAEVTRCESSCFI